MILSFKTEINGVKTFFKERILCHLGGLILSDYVESYSGLEYEKICYKALIESLSPKKLTIRDDPHNRWKAGRKIHFATGVRTKLYDCFAMGECKKVERIHFDWRGDNGTGIHLNYPGTDDKCNYLFWVDGSVLSYQEVCQLALDDGFDSLQSFFDFHYTENMKRGNGRWSFERKIIHF